jgi:hypothetical protein
MNCDRRHLGQAKQPRRLCARMAGDDATLAIDQNRDQEAELADARSELLELGGGWLRALSA